MLILVGYHGLTVDEQLCSLAGVGKGKDDQF